MALSGYTLTTYASLKLSIDKLKSLQNGDEVMNLLRIISYMYPDKIQKQVITNILQTPVNLFDKLLDVIHAKAIFSSNISNFGEHIETLSKYSILNVHENAEIRDEPYYKIHRLIQGCIRYSLSIAKKEKIINQNFYFFAQHDSIENWNHLCALVQYSTNDPHTRNKQCTVKLNQFVNMSIGKFYGKDPAHQLALKFIKRNISNSEYTIADYYAALKSCEGEFGSFAQIETKFKAYLHNIFKEVLNDHIIVIVIILKMLAKNSASTYTFALLENICLIYTSDTISLEHVNKKILLLEDLGLMDKILPNRLNNIERLLGAYLQLNVKQMDITLSLEKHLMSWTVSENLGILFPFSLLYFLKGASVNKASKLLTHDSPQPWERKMMSNWQQYQMTYAQIYRLTISSLLRVDYHTFKQKCLSIPKLSDHELKFIKTNTSNSEFTIADYCAALNSWYSSKSFLEIEPKFQAYLQNIFEKVKLNDPIVVIVLIFKTLNRRLWILTQRKLALLAINLLKHICSSYSKHVSSLEHINKKILPFEVLGLVDKIKPEHVGYIEELFAAYLELNIGTLVASVHLESIFLNLTISKEFGISFPSYLLYILKCARLNEVDHAIWSDVKRCYSLESWEEETIDTVSSNLTYSQIYDLIFPFNFITVRNLYKHNCEFVTNLFKHLTHWSPTTVISPELLDKITGFLSTNTWLEDQNYQEFEFVIATVNNKIKAANLDSNFISTFKTYCIISCLGKFRCINWLEILSADPAGFKQKLVDLEFVEKSSYTSEDDISVNAAMTYAVALSATIKERLDMFHSIVSWKPEKLPKLNWLNIFQCKQLLTMTCFVLYEKFLQINKTFSEDELIFPTRLCAGYFMDMGLSERHFNNILRLFINALNCSTISSYPIAIQWKSDLEECFNIILINASEKQSSFCEKLKLLLKKIENSCGKNIENSVGDLINFEKHPILNMVVKKLRNYEQDKLKYK